MKRLVGGFLLGSLASLASFGVLIALGPRMAEKGWM